MACPRKTGLGLLCLLAVFIQGCLCEEDDNLIPNEHSVPEKVEHGEKGTVHYNVETVKLSGNKHTKMDDKTKRPPWPPRPGRRNIISFKAKKTHPAIIRPGRSILESLKTKAKRSYQNNLLFRPGREDVQKDPPKFLRSGREDVPAGPQFDWRTERDEVPQLQPLFRPGREMAGPLQELFRPGREDVPQSPLFRPGRDHVPNGSPPLFRPGREDVPQTLLRPVRDNIPEQYHTVRAGRRSLGYNMPWTYVEGTVNSNLRHNTHTFRQKALEETKRNFQDESEQEMSDPNSLQEEQQDF